MFPKLRPRHEYQEEPDLETEKNKSDSKKAVHWHYGNSWGPELQRHKDTQTPRVSRVP